MAHWETPETYHTHYWLSYILAASGRPRKVGSSQRVSHESFVVDIYDDRCSFEFFTGWGMATSRPVHHRGCLLHYFLLPSLSNSLFLKHVAIVRALGCCCQLVGIHFPNKVLDFCLLVFFYRPRLYNGRQPATRTIYAVWKRARSGSLSPWMMTLCFLFTSFFPSSQRLFRDGKLWRQMENTEREHSSLSRQRSSGFLK
jgi:hypothetical protein